MKWKTWKKFGVIAMAVIMGAAFLAGCGSDSNNASSANKKELTYSKSQGPYSDLFEKGIKPILEKKGYKVTGKDMSDLLQADVALNEGEVDFNVEQHTAYMENFNQKQNGHLAAITPIPTVPAGIFPGSKTSLDQVADGDTIAVPNDASNTARAYALLQKIGWIKLDPNKDLSTVTQQDIVENPHHLKFTEMKSHLYAVISVTLSSLALSFTMLKSILRRLWLKKISYRISCYSSLSRIKIKMHNGSKILPMHTIPTNSKSI